MKKSIRVCLKSNLEFRTDITNFLRTMSMKKPADETVPEFLDLLIEFALYFASKTQVCVPRESLNQSEISTDTAGLPRILKKHDIEAKHDPELVESSIHIVERTDPPFSSVFEASLTMDSARSSHSKPKLSESSSQHKPQMSSVMSPKSSVGRFRIFSEQEAAVPALPAKLNYGIELPKPHRQSLPSEPPEAKIRVSDSKTAESFLSEYVHDILTHGQELLSKKIINYSVFLKYCIKAFDVLLAHEPIIAVNPEHINILLNTFLIPLLDDFVGKLTSSENNIERYSLQAVTGHLVRHFFDLSKTFLLQKVVTSLITWICTNMLSKLNKLEVVAKSFNLFMFEILAQEYNQIHLMFGYKERDLLVQCLLTALASISDRLTRLTTSGFNGILQNQAYNTFEMYRSLPRVLLLLKKILENSHNLITPEVKVCIT